MNTKGVTIIELLIVIVVLGIVSSVALLSVTTIIQNTKENVDQHNAEFVRDVIDDLIDQGVLSVEGNKLHNNETNRNYGGTGKAFYKDLDGYVGNRIIIQNPEGRNTYNQTNDGQYRFLFRIQNGVLEIYYYDDDKNAVVLATLDVS